MLKLCANSVAEIVAGNLYVEVGKSLAASLYNGGNYAYGSAAMRLDCLADRSEERRVGKECRSRWSPYH